MSDESTEKSASSYEKVMIAAREARRLNDRAVMTRIEPKEKVTTSAIRRAQKGDVDYTYEERQEEPKATGERPDLPTDDEER